ncbi:MAG: DUF2752 domain-containing protein [Acidobacteriota bacterium]
MENRRSAWTWALAGLAGLAALALLHVWIPDPDPARALCPSRRFLGIPCPGCGLTRAFAHLAKGEWSAALIAHPLAPVLAVEAFAGWLVWGTGLRRPLPRWDWIGPVTIGNLAVLCALWLGRLATGTLPW